MLHAQVAALGVWCQLEHEESSSQMRGFSWHRYVHIHMR
jgi:hypothetical protein